MNHETGTGGIRIRPSDGRAYVRGADGSATTYARAVLAAKIGRLLAHDEQAHHINGDPTDDRPENLQLVTASAHQMIHGHSWKTSRWTSGKCSGCGCLYDERTPGCQTCRIRDVARRRKTNDVLTPNSAKTHCPQGHPYDQANTSKASAKGGRACKACKRERERLRRMLRRAEIQS